MTASAILLIVSGQIGLESLVLLGRLNNSLFAILAKVSMSTSRLVSVDNETTSCKVLTAPKLEARESSRSFCWSVIDWIILYSFVSAEAVKI
jgi:hypothetical protein